MSYLVPKRPAEWEGVLLVDKPSGITSHDVVARIRKKFGMKRVGHAGTLDPMATGLLIILLGRATKASQYLTSLNKVYEGTIRLGQTTDSYDADGVMTEEKPVPNFTPETILQQIHTFMGDQYQVPPMFSAKKVNGVPLYKLARKGESIDREPRFIHVSRFELLSLDLPTLDFCVACSKGTYVRSLAHDLGQKLGCGGYLQSLRRTQIDHFQVEEALTLEALAEQSLSQIRLLPVRDAVPGPQLT